jgi:hypothetical protein
MGLLFTIGTYFSHDRRRLQPTNCAFFQTHSLPWLLRSSTVLTLFLVRSLLLQPCASPMRFTYTSALWNNTQGNRSTTSLTYSMAHLPRCRSERRDGEIPTDLYDDAPDVKTKSMTVISPRNWSSSTRICTIPGTLQLDKIDYLQFLIIVVIDNHGK